MWRALSGLVAIALALAAAPRAAGGAQKLRITMPVAALSMTPVYVAKSRGFFAEEGLDVEVTVTGGGGPDVAALIAGDVDFTFTAGDVVIVAYQAGKRLRVVMTAMHRPIINWAIHNEVARARGITEATPLPEKMKALKGLNVGVTQVGSLTSHLANYVVRRAGYVPHQDVKIIAVGAGPTWVAALENRRVDVALMSPPVPDTAIARGFASMFINNVRGDDPALTEFLMEGLHTRPDVIEKNPDLVRKMVRALLRSNKWALGSTPPGGHRRPAPLPGTDGSRPPAGRRPGHAPGPQPGRRDQRAPPAGHAGGAPAGGGPEDQHSVWRVRDQRVPAALTAGVRRGRTAVARIFWVTCPKCRGRFYCHYDDFRGKGIPLLCPYCGLRFLDSESPQIEE